MRSKLLGYGLEQWLRITIWNKYSFHDFEKNYVLQKVFTNVGAAIDCKTCRYSCCLQVEHIKSVLSKINIGILFALIDVLNLSVQPDTCIKFSATAKHF